jgi:signal transduction histidine kinase
MKSLKLRLATGILLSISVVFILLWLAASHSIRLLVEEQMSTRLTHDSESLLSHLQFDNSEQIQLNSSEIDSIYHRPFSGHYFVIHSGTTRIRSRSLWDNDLTLATQISTGSRQLRIIGPQQQPLLAVQSIYQKRGKIISITVAEDLSSIEKQINHFRNWFGVVALIVLLLLVLLQVFIVRLSLVPLDRVRQQISDLEAGKRSQLDNNVPTELQPLVNEVNRLLSRIGQRLQRSRNALGDLAHALKKPLTILTQLSQDECIRHCDDIQEQIDYQSAEIKRSIDHVLKRARLAGEGPAMSQFSLQQDLPALLDTLAKMYPDKVITSSLAIDNKNLLPFDREDMMELLGNIIDNACKWADHKIQLSIEIDDALQLSVQDDGPGIGTDDLHRLTARGTRLDENTHGHGLGLAIVRDIIQQYKGSISFAKTRLYDSGLRVDISLPLKQASGSV